MKNRFHLPVSVIGFHCPTLDIFFHGAYLLHQFLWFFSLFLSRSNFIRQAVTLSLQSFNLCNGLTTFPVVLLKSSQRSRRLRPTPGEPLLHLRQIGAHISQIKHKQLFYRVDIGYLEPAGAPELALSSPKGLAFET